MSLNLEKFIFYLLVFSIPIGTRKILGYFGSPANEWNGISVYATDVLVWIILGLWFWQSLASLQFRIRAHIRPKFWRCGALTFLSLPKSTLVLFGFIFFALISLLWGPKDLIGFYRWLRLAEYAFLFLWLKSRRRNLNLRVIAAVLIAAALLQSTLAIAQFFRQEDLGLQFLGESQLGQKFAGVAKIDVGRVKLVRAYGLFPHPNVLAAFIGVAIILLGWLFDQNRWRWFLKYFVFLGALNLLIFAFLLTFSRAMVASLLIVMSAGFFWALYHWRAKAFLWFLEYSFAFFVLLQVWALLLNPILINRVAISPTEEAVTQRIFYSKIALSVIRSSPLFGVGIGNFTGSLPQFLEQDAVIPSTKYPAWILQPVHNIYLLIASETGLLGLTAFLLFLFFLIRENLKGSKNFYFLFPIFYLLLVGFADHFLLTLQQGSLLLWVALGLLSL